MDEVNDQHLFWIAKAALKVTYAPPVQHRPTVHLTGAAAGALEAV
jgi:hypothetical protein